MMTKFFQKFKIFQSNQRRAKSRNRNNQNHDFHDEREVVVRGDQRVGKLITN